MPQPLDYLKETPSQTAGPYVHIGLAPFAAGFEIFDTNFGPDPAGPDADGEHITVKGIVYDAVGAPIKDILIEVWQANSYGKYQHPDDRRDLPVDPNFRGWGRICSDFDTGEYAFKTVKPGGVTGRSGQPMAPHINFWLVARGINVGLNTRMYFEDEADANAADPVINLIEQVNRRRTLIARKTGPSEYTFDIHIQGDSETVFFDI